MNVIMAIKLAFKGIVSNKVRTILTMLGIIIGVSSVIVLVSVAQGATENVTSSIESLGSNILNVNISGRGLDTSITYDESLDMNDLKGVSKVSSIVNGQATAKYDLNSMDTTVEGVDANYTDVRNHRADYGRFITSLDIEARNKVALIGVEVADEIFKGVSPIGKTIQLNGSNFEVVGILEEKGSSVGGSSDDKILIPISTAQRFFQSEGVKSIYIQAESSDTVNIAEANIENFLLKKFDENEDSYTIFNQSEMLSTVNNVTNTMTLMLGGIAGISLLVGGIGIMNIMLVSVTERTKEIGIRKAIGAKRKDILSQFLLESSVISGLGGILGIIVGLLVNYLLTKFTGLTTQSSVLVLLIAFSFSIVVGVFFGMYPANKASKLRPVDALRFE